jgi:hypothetical protein
MSSLSAHLAPYQAPEIPSGGLNLKFRHTPSLENTQTVFLKKQENSE